MNISRSHSRKQKQEEVRFDIQIDLLNFERRKRSQFVIFWVEEALHLVETGRFISIFAAAAL